MARNATYADIAKAATVICKDFNIEDDNVVRGCAAISCPCAEKCLCALLFVVCVFWDVNEALSVVSIAVSGKVSVSC